MDAQDGVFIVEGDAGVEDFLAPALDFGVVALDGIEIEVLGVASAPHGGGGASSQADAQGRSAQLDDERAFVDRFLMDMAPLDIAHAPGSHDGLVIAAIPSVVAMFIGAENARELGASEFIAEPGPAQRAIRHDFQGGGEPFGKLGVVLFPGHDKAGDPEV